MFNYIPSNTYNTTDNLDIIRNAGDAFGQFQMMLSDFDASSLYETIPNFHNTPSGMSSSSQTLRLIPRAVLLKPVRNMTGY